MDKELKNISVIIPVYNTGQYVTQCIESLKNHHLNMEIIIVDDGSTDDSGLIADEFAQKDSRIIVIHQENKGLSAARNRGMDAATGEYIFFLDSDDWIKEHSLDFLYAEASKRRVDVITGNALFCYPDGQADNPFGRIAKHIIGVPLTGKQCFIELMKTSAYAPMAYNYICKRDFLQHHHFRFEDVMHEDELWTPILIGSAQSALVTDFDFYYYRQERENSIMNSTDPKKRLNALFYVTDRLVNYAAGFSFEQEEKDFRSWLYVVIFRLYFNAFELLLKSRDSAVRIPQHHLYSWENIRHHLAELPKVKIAYYFNRSAAAIREYEKWLHSEWVTVMQQPDMGDRKIILIFNKMWGEELSIPLSEIPADFVITTDRRYFERATAVVFHLPDLLSYRNGDLYKHDGQVWVAWYLESEANYPWIRNPEITEFFDIRMSYRQDAGVVYPYYRYEYSTVLKQPVMSSNRLNRTCMFISSRLNRSGREEYLEELMNCTDVDSFGKLFNNKRLSDDLGIESKINEYQKYKFVIAFENSIDTDYVTEKFYDPLLAGAVPVYLGAPNIEEFAPGDHSFVDVRQYDSPKSLARFINKCCEDEGEYAKFFEWKKQPLRQSFLQKAIIQKIHPFARLCKVINDRLLPQSS